MNNFAKKMLAEILAKKQEAQLTAAYELQKIGAGAQAQDTAIIAVSHALQSGLDHHNAIDIGINKGWTHELYVRDKRANPELYNKQ